LQVSSKTIRGILLHLMARLRGNGLAQKFAAAEPPLRSELFSSDQMKEHGKGLADSHKLGLAGAPDRLLTRLAENEGVLIGVCNLLKEAATANRRIAPAGEWLLDNFYLIEEQIRTARRYLPKGYSRELPRLLNGPSAGLPRVYDIALEIISHGDGRIDLESLSSFVAAYQTVTVLKLGELWAIPIMLRLALIENLRRGQSGLWGYAISGDLPIVLLRIGDPAHIEPVRQLVQAHAYWRLKGLAVDLVIWNEDHAGYRQLLQEQIMGLIAAGIEANVTDRPGGIFVRPVDQISNEDRILLQTVARAILTDSRGTLWDQIHRRGLGEVTVPRLTPTLTRRAYFDDGTPLGSASNPECQIDFIVMLSCSRKSPTPSVD
jgi:hypothetical protein